MAVSLTKGQKVDLTKDNPGLSKIIVGLGWDTNKYDGGADFDLDAAAFLLNAEGKVTSDGDFVFYRNLKHTSGAVEHLGDNLTGEGDGDDEQIKINLKDVPAAIEKIDLTVTIYEADTLNQNFGQVSNAYIRIVEESTGRELIRYDLGEDFSVETAVVVGEFYRYKGEWKFNAIGGGFRGGLEALCNNYGVRSTGTSAVELKKGQKVNLDKRHGHSLGEILINLNWNQNTSSGQGLFGSLFGGSSGIDLDLGCLFELKNGKKGCVQALGNSFGSLQNEPYISLDGDDRTGANSGGENLRVNGNMASQIKRILVYTFIYEGAANWQQARGVVTVRSPGSQDIIVRMDEYNTSDKMCAIALIENVNGDNFSVEKLVRFFSGHEQMDRAYGWGMRWVAGRK